MHTGDISGIMGNRGIATYKSRQAERVPPVLISFMVHKALTLKFTGRISGPVRQGHIMVNCCYMLGGHPDFNHLDIIAGVKYFVADFRRLEHTIARLKAKRVALIFIDKVNPAAITKDQLKPHGMIMHHIRNRPTIRDADMAGNNRPPQPVRDQVPVMHASTPNYPRSLI